LAEMQTRTAAALLLAIGPTAVIFSLGS